MKKFTRTLAMLLALVMALSVFAACGGENTEETKGNTVTVEPVSFPLAEPYYIDIMFKGDMDWADLEQSTWYKKLCEETNVYINPINLGSEPMTTLNALLNSKKYGEVIFDGVLNDTTLTELAYGGFLLPIEDFLTNEQIMPNYVNRGLANLPQALAVATLPDGHVYSVARIDTLAAAQLESPLHMNADWLAQANMEAPTTLEEFEQALIYFRDHDMNGNGDTTDEIPLLLSTSAGNPYAHVQALLGFWGMPTKDSALDSYCYIENGVVKIVPYTETYKEAIKTIRRWYQEGLIWSECFTSNTESFNSRLNSDTAIWGACPVMSYSTSKEWSEDMITIKYPAPEGYTPRAYINCGVNGYKNTFTLTNNCENPSVVMAWLDKLYSQEAQAYTYYGLPNDEELGMPNKYDVIDGQYVFYELTEEESKEWEEKNTSLSKYIGASIYMRTDEDYACNAVVTAGGMQQRIDSYNIYKDIINTEIWPRPYYTEEVSNQIGLLRTDVYAIIQQYEVKWITDKDADIDADWEAYKAALKTAGVEDLEKLLQQSYDLYLDAMPDMG